MSSDSISRCQDVSVTFGTTTALQCANVDIARGELVAVMGSSGSGKSTLLHALAGLIPLDDGTVTFDGTDMAALNDAQRSEVRLRRMGLVFQFGELVPELSLVENVALPLWLLGNDRRTATSAARELLDRFDISAEADKRPADVSGGQMQRAAVARALVHRPDVVFADEPTGALDSANAQIVLEALVDGAREHGAAVVLVTHESRLASYCDREVVIRDGITGTPTTDDHHTPTTAATGVNR
jgi:putative ABC transport system ATP-binding protein